MDAPYPRRTSQGEGRALANDEFDRSGAVSLGLSFPKGIGYRAFIRSPLPGSPHGIAVFPGAGHGLFTEDPDPAKDRASQLAPGFL